MFGLSLKKKIEEEPQNFKFAKLAIKNMVLSFKESKEHTPVPDYGLKKAYEDCAVSYAKDALNIGMLPANITIALNHIVDFDRLQKEGKSVPVNYFEKVISGVYQDI